MFSGLQVTATRNLRRIIMHAFMETKSVSEYRTGQGDSLLLKPRSARGN